MIGAILLSMQPNLLLNLSFGELSHQPIEETIDRRCCRYCSQWWTSWQSSIPMDADYFYCVDGNSSDEDRKPNVNLSLCSCLYICLYISASINVFVYLSLCICLYASVFIYLPLYLSIYICLYVSVFMYLSLCIWLYISAFKSVSNSEETSISVFIYLPL